ncbi:MAG: bifunctional 4-hydroxy-2-oxoglutarate aldolase/2-dehydro-3-deoxy-phosphogluconate aldolase [Acidobacteriota bacterium]
MTVSADPLRDVLARSPVIPVLKIERRVDAVPLARALVEGGLSVLEVTLRTDVALDALAAMVEEVPEATVGVGTVLTPEDLEASAAAGAQFAVSPGLTPALAEAASRWTETMPLLPGVSTASEAMIAREVGFSTLKCFPASTAGGPAFLKSLYGPLPDLAFCPTGGIGPDSFREYLTLPNVICVGGSWVAPAAAVNAGDWERIVALARDAVDRSRR